MPNDVTVDVIKKIEEMTAPVTFAFGDQTYSSKPLHRIEPHVDRPKALGVSGLDSAVQLIRREISNFPDPVFIRVCGPRNVDVLTTLLPDKSRDTLYQVSGDFPEHKVGSFQELDAAMISLRSQYIYDLDDPDDGVRYLVELLSSITNEESVKTTDNGLTQKVEARSGIAMISTVAIKPRVKLRPYRTFREVAQPQSEFLVRLDKKQGGFALFECDGGMWKQEAKENIREYFQEELADLISEGRVVVMM